MNAVRVMVETPDAAVEYVVHVRNRSRFALAGAMRSGWRRYPDARAVSAEFTEHHCDSCRCSHAVTPVRRVFRRQKRSAA